MKKNIALSVLALSAVLHTATVFADETVATGETTLAQDVEKMESVDVVGGIKNVVKKTTGAVKKTVGTVNKKLKIGEAAPSTDGDSDGDVSPVPAKKAEGSMKAEGSSKAEDDSKDAEGSRKVSDTSITIFSQNAYIQSIMENTTHIKSARLKELLARGDKATMLDIRPRAEFAKSPGIKGVTLNIPRNFLEVEAYEKLPNKDASIIIISTKGIRGGLAANTLQNMGYTNVRNLMDGLEGWNKAK